MDNNSFEPKYPDINSNPTSPNNSKLAYVFAACGFILGAILTYTLLLFIYPDILRTKTDDGNNQQVQTTQSSRENTQKDMNENAVISDQELDDYNKQTGIDCTTIEKFKLEQQELVATNYTLENLDTVNRKINITRPKYDGGTEKYSISWLTLPAVVDADCKPSSWSKLNKGDKINLYVSSDNRYIDNGTDYVQKANR